MIEITGGGGFGAIALPVRDPGSGAIVSIVLVSGGLGYASVPTVTIKGGGGSGATARAIHTYIAMSAPAADPTQNMTVKAALVDDPTFEEVKFDLTFSQQGRPFFVWAPV